jgi:tRNA-dihydrouridine synthase B
MEKQPKIYLAPFQGITGVTYRSIYTKHFQGVDKLFTPFFTGIHKDAKLPPRRLMELGNPAENGIEVVPQVLSKDADEILSFARLCQNLGFSEINWNLGCPFPQVANKKRGSGMLPYPEMITEILDKVMAETGIRFSIKCRLGYESTDEIFKLLPIFNQYKISELTIHARIGKQLYKGEPNQETFRNAVTLSTVPLVYNGDIFSLSDFQLFDDRFASINTWMIGRGLLSDPFLPALIKGLPLPENRKEHIRHFIDDLYLGYRRQMKDNLPALGVLKEYWHYLAESFNNPHKVFKKLKKVNSFSDYEAAVTYVFDNYEWVGSGNKQDINIQDSI